MGKLLYITANSKPENLSSSKTVGRAFVNQFKAKHPDFTVEELDLYTAQLPRPKYNFYENRSTLVNKPAFDKLSPQDQAEVQQMIKLCDQFISADVYVLAAPMWSLSFPAPVKEYIDCIVQTGKTIKFDGTDKPKGMLNDKPRTFIYIQSSGANIPWFIEPVMDKGVNYVEVIMRYLGIAKFEDLLIDGTGSTEAERVEAVQNAESKIESIISAIVF
jgi:FMN-dependent NADH-azoreductase